MKRLLLLTLVLLGGCRHDVAFSVYGRDVADIVADPSQVLSANVTLTLEVPSEDYCGDNGGWIAERLAGVVENWSVWRCERRDFDSTMVVEAKVPMIGIQGPNADIDVKTLPTALAVAVLIDQQPGAHGVALLADEHRMARVAAEAEAEAGFIGGGGIDLIVADVRYQNDTREPATVRVVSSFVGPDAWPFLSDPYTLDDRGELLVELSDVLAEAWLADGKAIPLYVETADGMSVFSYP